VGGLRLTATAVVVGAGVPESDMVSAAPLSRIP
jgi:hypothetical protein